MFTDRKMINGYQKVAGGREREGEGKHGHADGKNVTWTKHFHINMKRMCRAA